MEIALRISDRIAILLVILANPEKGTASVSVASELSTEEAVVLTNLGSLYSEIIWQISLCNETMADEKRTADQEGESDDDTSIPALRYMNPISVRSGSEFLGSAEREYLSLVRSNESLHRHSQHGLSRLRGGRNGRHLNALNIDSETPHSLPEMFTSPYRCRADAESLNSASKILGMVLAQIFFETLGFNGISCYPGFADTSLSVKCRYLGKEITYHLEATSQLLWTLPPSIHTPGIEHKKAGETNNLSHGTWLLDTLQCYCRVLEYFVNSSLLLYGNSASKTQLVGAGLLNGIFSIPRDPENFVRMLQCEVLDVILPIWNHPLFPNCCPGFMASVVSLVMHSRGSPATSETNSVEMAMEWLVSHADDPVQEDDELARALALSLGNSSETSKVDSVDKLMGFRLPKLTEEGPPPLPPIDDILNASLKLFQCSNNMTFSLTDLFVALCNHNKGEDRPKVLSFLIQQLKLCPLDFSKDSTALCMISHIVALFLSEDGNTREIAGQNGIVPAVIDILMEFKARNDLGSKITAPKCISALLLISDDMLQSRSRIFYGMMEVNFGIVKFGRRYEFVDGGVLIHSDSQELSETIQTKPDSSGSDGCRRREGKQPEGMKDEDWALLDRQALGYVREAIGLKQSSFDEAIIQLRMTEGASVAQHLNELNTITTQLSSVEIEFDDEVRALILLSSLPDSWNATVTAVSSHFKRDCRALKKDTGAQESANVTEETGDAMILSVNSPIESWILDSGASFHSTPCQESWRTMSVVILGSLMEKDIAQPFQAVNGRLPKEHSSLLVARPYERERDEDTFVKREAAGSKECRCRTMRGLHLWQTKESQFCKDWQDTQDRKESTETVDSEISVQNNGIKMETTVPKTPQHNGVAERMNRTLNERARSMRIHAGLPKFLWAEAINTAAYLINRGPSVPLDGRIPEEVWSKKEINLSHLRVFGCISYFGYRFWDYENRKIIRSRDVIFNENVMYKDRSTAESKCYDEAMQVEDSVKWESSMKDEMDSLMSNQTWELAELPPGKKALHNKWIYRIKEEHDGSKRYKARLVVKGFQQKEDVKTAFLHGDLEEEIYMRQPEGFIEADKKTWLRHARDYTLEAKIVEAVCYEGSGRCKADSWDEDQERHKVGTLMLSQAEYINKVLSRFNMQDAKPVSTPLGVHFRLSKDQSPKTEEERAHMVKVPYASAIGSLMYAMVCTRPDIAHAVGAVSRYMNNPGKVHWEAVKWILRYLRGTTNKALCFKGGDMILTGYVDADLAGNVDIRRSTTGYVYTLGGTAVSWVSQLQKIVALSTTEAEYVAVTEASKEMVWLQSFLEELGKNKKTISYANEKESITPFEKILGKSTGYLCIEETEKLLLLACDLIRRHVPAAVMQAVLQHLLEDPQTLQTAMELEIKQTLSGSRHAGRVSPRTSMAPVICRDPVGFMKAATAICQLESSGGRPFIVLLKEKERDRDKLKASGAEVGLGSNESVQIPESKVNDGTGRYSKGHKKIPANLAQVIDQLLEIVLKYPSEKGHEDNAIGLTSMEIDEPASKVKGVILKRDSEMGQHRVSNQSDASGSPGIVHHILHSLLPLSVDKSSGLDEWRDKLSEKASWFLVVLCGRSCEGRKRVINELVKALSSLFNVESNSINNSLVPDKRVFGFADLSYSILSKNSSSSNLPGTGCSPDIAKSMIEGRVVQYLTNILEVIDLDHSDAPKTVNLMLKALESLTRAANANEQFFKLDGSNKKKSSERHIDQVTVSAVDEIEHTQNGSGQQADVDAEVTEQQQHQATSQIENYNANSNDPIDQDMRVEVEPAASNTHVELVMDFMHEEIEGGVLHNTEQIEMTFRVENRADDDMGDEDDDMADDGDDDEGEGEDEDIAEDGAGMISLADTYVEDHDDYGLGDDYNDDMIDEEDDDFDGHRVIEVRWREALDGLDHLQVLGQPGAASGLIDQTAEPFEGVNVDDLFGLRRPVGFERRRSNGRSSFDRSVTEVNGFQLPLLLRPSQSGDLSSMRSSGGNSFRDLEAISSGSFDVTQFYMFDAPGRPYDQAPNGLFGHRLGCAAPTPLTDYSVGMDHCICKGGGGGDGRWTDDGQPQASAQAAAIAQAVEEQFISHFCSTTPSNDLAERHSQNSGIQELQPLGATPSNDGKAVPNSLSVAGEMAESIQRREGILSQTFSLNNAPDERDNMEIGDRNGATVSDQVEQFSEMVNLPEGDSAVPGNLSLQAMGDDGLSGGDGRAGNHSLTDSALEMPVPGDSNGSSLHEHIDVEMNTTDAEGNQTEQSIPLEIGAGEPDTLESQDANQADQASVNIEGPEVLASQQSQSVRPPTDVPPSADNIDLEFLAALPPDIQAEVLAQQRAQRVALQAEGRPVDMDNTSIIATFPADIREEVLLTSSEEVLSLLPLPLLAEAQMLRDRATSHYHARSLFGGSHRLSNRRNGLGLVRQTVMDRGVGITLGRRPGSTISSGLKDDEIEGEPLLNSNSLKAIISPSTASTGIAICCFLWFSVQPSLTESELGKGMGPEPDGSGSGFISKDGSGEVTLNSGGVGFRVEDARFCLGPSRSRPEAMRAQMSLNQMEVHLQTDGQQQHAKDERNCAVSFEKKMGELKAKRERQGVIVSLGTDLGRCGGANPSPYVTDSRTRIWSERLCPRVVFTSAWDSGSLLELTPYGPRDGIHLRMDIRSNMERTVQKDVEDNANVLRLSEQSQLTNGDSMIPGYVSELFGYTHINLYGDIPYLLDVPINRNMFRALAQFWNPAYSCFTFGRVDMTPTIEEHQALVRCPRSQIDRIYTKLPVTPSFKKKLLLMTGMSEDWVIRNIKKKGDSECISWAALKEVIAHHPDKRKKLDLFALGIYGLVIFPKVLGYVDVSVVDLFERLDKHVDPVPVILAETFRAPGRVFIEGFSPLKDFLSKEWPGGFTEEKWMVIFKDIRDGDILWRASWNTSSDILYRCGERDWVPLPGIWGSVGYAPLLVSRQYGSRQFIPATWDLVGSDFAFKGDQYKGKVKGVAEAWKQTRRVNLFTYDLGLSQEYEQWRSGRVNDNIPIVNPENIQLIEEQLRVVPSPLELAKHDFEAERRQWRMTLQKLEDEVYQKGLEIDIQKSRADRIEKVEKQLRLDFDDLRSTYQRMVKAQAGSSSSKSVELRQEVASLKRVAGESQEELKQSRHQVKILSKENDSLEQRLQKSQAQNEKLKEKISSLETALRRYQSKEGNSSRGEVESLKRQVSELEAMVQEFQRQSSELSIVPYEGDIQWHFRWE
ncbi:E3 ubiquitin protein ligase upl2, putative isoform 2 [Hibiscus syriacus]|uniref:E3 ubiquitin protein ligase upl2, putative isoform 2 n=1 Tax=Hibiscus syriacus TaxID=106335 RepID=A0A6A2WWP0_HIBSY|nr:E3 ubiquitin protein ligase upl2, putative isoform 2 [Hibiscus syriacus]